MPITEAQPGARLAASVWHPEHPEQELLKAGYALDETVLARLRQIGVQAIYVDYPDLSDLDRHLIPALSPERQRVYQQIKRTIAAIERTAKPTVTFPDYYVATRQLVITLLSQGPQAIYMEQLAARMPDDEVTHATAVAHLSLMLGIRLEQYLIEQRSRLSPQHAKEVVNLGVAGMLHDIGKVRLSVSARAATALHAPDDEETRDEYESHARLGYEMVRGGVESSAAGAILHHHQRYDGSGFPHVSYRGKQDQPLRGDEIHVFARVIGAADEFDRVAVDPVSRQRRENIVALNELSTRFVTALDPVVMNIMPSVIPPFPPGHLVRLDDGSEAVVTDVNPAAPYLPTVRRVTRLDGGAFTVDGLPVITAAADQPRIRSINGVDCRPLMPAFPAAAA